MKRAMRYQDKAQSTERVEKRTYSDRKVTEYSWQMNLDRLHYQYIQSTESNQGDYMFLILKSHDSDPSEIIGLFTTLELAQQYIETMDDVEPFSDDEYDEYDPKTVAKGFWVDGYAFYIHKVDVIA